jgi:hypothetical protein
MNTDCRNFAAATPLGMSGAEKPRTVLVFLSAKSKEQQMFHLKPRSLVLLNYIGDLNGGAQVTVVGVRVADCKA